jgi:peroxiredoxin
MENRIYNDQPAPDFTLNDLNGRAHTLSDLCGQIVILNFWSAECPWAQRADEALLSLIEDRGNEVVLLPIAANANEAPPLLKEAAAERGLPLVLHDKYQHVADLYGAQATPHIFVLDKKGILRYQGAFNDVTFRQKTPTQQYVQDAVEAVLAGERPDPAQTPPYGCAIVRYD